MGKCQKKIKTDVAGLEYDTKVVKWDTYLLAIGNKKFRQITLRTRASILWQYKDKTNWCGYKAMLQEQVKVMSHQGSQLELSRGNIGTYL